MREEKTKPEIAVNNHEKQKMKEAAYMIADATQKIRDINESMKADGRWRGQADIAAVLSSLDEICEECAGGIGYYLRTM